MIGFRDCADDDGVTPALASVRAGAETSLPEAPRGRGVLNELLVRLRGV